MMKATLLFFALLASWIVSISGSTPQCFGLASGQFPPSYVRLVNLFFYYYYLYYFISFILFVINYY